MVILRKSNENHFDLNDCLKRLLYRKPEQKKLKQLRRHQLLAHGIF